MKDIARTVGSAYKPCSRVLKSVFDVIIEEAKAQNAKMLFRGTTELDGTTAHEAHGAHSLAVAGPLRISAFHARRAGQIRGLPFACRKPL